MIKNPILKGFNPDPSICRVGEDYYIAVSTFEWFPGVRIYHSKDLEHWHLIARPLNTLKHLDMRGNPNSGGVFAPCLSYDNGLFYLIFSDVRVTGGAWADLYNYVTTAKEIDGIWSEPQFLNGSGIDPSLFHDPSGKKYFVNMIWDHRTHHHAFYGIVMQEFCPKEHKLIGSKEIIYKGSALGVTESPHLYYIDGYYYLLVAEGGTSYEHAATIARSKSIHGPYETHPDNPLLSSWSHPELRLQKAGHASLVQTHNDQWYLAHLTSRPIKPASYKLMHRGYSPLGRETALQKLYWQDGWPYVVGGNYPQEEVEGINVDRVIWSKAASIDHFDEAELQEDFQTLRIPFNEEIGSLRAHQGYLRLYGRESLHSCFVQSYVARRWQSLHFIAQTACRFDPESFQQQAGLVCYYNTKNWTSLHITWHEEKGRILDLVNADCNQVKHLLIGKEIEIPLDVKDVWMQVKVDGLKYRYSYSFDEGKSWQEISIDCESWKLSDDYVQADGDAFFTGAFVGMNCIDVTGQRLAADFDFFEYRELD